MPRPKGYIGPRKSDAALVLHLAAEGVPFGIICDRLGIPIQVISRIIACMILPQLKGRKDLAAFLCGDVPRPARQSTEAERCHGNYATRIPSYDEVAITGVSFGYPEEK